MWAVFLMRTCGSWPSDYTFAMTEDFLGMFLGNSNRAKVARVFVFNQMEVFTASQAAKRSGVNPTLVSKEIKVLEHLHVLKRAKLSIQVGKGKRIVPGKQKEPAWIFDEESKNAIAVSRFVHEVSPVQYKKVMLALKSSGRLSTVVLSGNFMGDSSRPVDLVLAVDGVNESKLDAAIKRLEPEIGREIRYAVFSTPEFEYRLNIKDRLIRDTLDFPHMVLLDRARLL